MLKPDRPKDTVVLCLLCITYMRGNVPRSILFPTPSFDPVLLTHTEMPNKSSKTRSSTVMPTTTASNVVEKSVSIFSPP